MFYVTGSGNTLWAHVKMHATLLLLRLRAEAWRSYSKITKVGIVWGGSSYSFLKESLQVLPSSDKAVLADKPNKASLTLEKHTRHWARPGFRTRKKHYWTPFDTKQVQHKQTAESNSPPGDFLSEIRQHYNTCWQKKYFIAAPQFVPWTNPVIARTLASCVYSRNFLH